MIAHGFVVVGLFFIADIIYRRYETRTIDEMGGIRTQAPNLRCFNTGIGLVALPTTLTVGEFTVLYSFVNKCLCSSGGTTIILGAYYMLKMYQHVMLEKQMQKYLQMLVSRKV
jgi:NADH-quinone oxidoreductase subunit M